VKNSLLSFSENFISMDEETCKGTGIFISYDTAGNERKNVTKKIEKFDAKLGTWGCCPLSIFGRS